MNERHGAIPVFYSSRMVAPSASSFSPSAAKPAAVAASWRKLPVALAWHEPQPATVAELCLAHDADFVTDVLACRRNNGFNEASAEVAASLPWTTGSLLSAARYVLAHKAPVAAAPCSGFHHACYASAGGFCTFNGLMVTALSVNADLAARGEDGCVAILDCDMHYGDGTDDIIARLGVDRARVVHVDVGARYFAAKHAREFLQVLPQLVEELAECDVILYQAGADPHVDDPLGGWLTTEELRARDALVFESAQKIGVPVLWNLAGGYQREKDGSIPKVLAIHDNTMLECARVFGG